jgi:two-component system sensor histidine kinase MprB
VDLVVEDGGPGVAPEDLPHLFEKFYRRRPAGSAVEPRSGGMGIGLSVARGLAEAMGAVVTAEPSSLGGLAIRFHLPAAPSVP